MSDLPSYLVQRFVETLRASLDEAAADGILLSGGLDTSTIAAYAAEGRAPSAVTVCVPSDEPVDAVHRQMLASKLGCETAAFPSPDAVYAQHCARVLHMPLDLWWLTLDELLTYAAATIRAIRSFDPMQVRNGITIYCGLLRAKTLGIRRVYTGDGADEMYAGYSHMWTMPPDQLHARTFATWPQSCGSRRRSSRPPSASRPPVPLRSRGSSIWRWSYPTRRSSANGTDA